MIFRKFLSLLLAFLITVIFVGCRSNKEALSGSDVINLTSNGGQITKKDYLTLLYSAADTFNPYTLKTDINRQLCKLLYEPLVKVSNEFEAVLSLAKSVEMDGKTCKVILKTAKFSDGTTVTGEDVQYSYNLAKNSQTVYGKKLYEVESVSASANTVTFNLSKTDPYFQNLLDFPIIKKGSDENTDSDSVKLPPVGCGRYKLNEVNDGLVINSNYFGKSSAVKTIRLINAPDTESVSHYAEIGASDMYFSEISDGNIMRMSGTREDINLNNLVYIGINQNYAQLNESSLRHAISTSLNRVKICEEAYYNNAVAATGFFHPFWKETKSVQNIQITANEEITIENLEKIGYNKLDSVGVRINSNGTPLKFTLMVNTENRIRVLAANTIANQLKNIGIEITVIEKTYEQYLEALKTGQFQLYLGEIKFTDNMDVSSLVFKEGSAAYGLPKTANEETASETQDIDEAKNNEIKVTSSQTVVEEFYNGNATIKDVASVLQTEMPVIPLCYRTGVLFYNDKIENVKNASLSDIYFSIDSYLIN